MEQHVPIIPSMRERRKNRRVLIFFLHSLSTAKPKKRSSSSFSARLPLSSLFVFSSRERESERAPERRKGFRQVRDRRLLIHKVFRAWNEKTTSRGVERRASFFTNSPTLTAEAAPRLREMIVDSDSENPSLDSRSLFVSPSLTPAL